MGAEINKQYLLLAGKPILAHTLQVFQDTPFIDDIYVVIPAAEIPYCQEHVVERHGLTKVRQIVPGGAERQHSVMNGLQAVVGAGDDDVVLIHDGALVAVPAKDTVKVVVDGIVRATPPREDLWLAQTPQAFRYPVIRAAHEIAAAERYLGTDDASLVERLGKEIHIVMGDYRNIKITTPEDLILAEAFLRM